MKLVDGRETILVVAGSSDAALAKDRPLALWLRDEINRRSDGQAYRRAVVVGDARFAEARELHRHPTIAVGGPGSNGIVQHLSSVLPMVWTQDDRSFVQMAPEGGGRQVALWGMDADGTKAAVEAFVAEGMLDALLAHLWPFPQATLS
jgi:hypothetical protein